MSKIYFKRLKDLVRPIYDALKNLLSVLPKYLILKKSLRSKGISGLTPFKIRSWHHGSCYFLCRTETRECFIKTDLKFGLLENELKCEQVFKKKYPHLNLLEIYFIDLNYQYVAYEYVEFPTLKDFFYKTKNTKKAKLDVLNELIFFLDALYQMNIVYRDIKMDNFFVSMHGNLVPFDFSFAVSMNESIVLKELIPSLKNEKILYYMGRPSQSSSFCWDDALGMFNLLDELEKLSSLDLSFFKKKVKANIGRITYRYDPVYFQVENNLGMK